jgi:hypothetical protein
VSNVNDPQSFALCHVADFENQNNLHTKNQAEPWIWYGFKDVQIKVTHYSIFSRRDDNGNHLRLWALESLKDGWRWVKIDDHPNDALLNALLKKIK